MGHKTAAFLARVTVVAALFIPGTVSSIGVGSIDLRSGLNQPFLAEIALVSVRDEDDNLSIKLASTADFRRAGIPRPRILLKLKFRVVEKPDGSSVIEVTSDDTIREPFLNFLVEVDWSNGHILREYTVLLDPPVYDHGVTATIQSPVAARPSAPAPAPAPSPVVATPSAPAPVMVASPVSIDGETYGPTRRGDTLWSIAAAARGASSISMNQVMLAILRSNPEAFILDNVHTLRRGHILRIPDRSDMAAIDLDEAGAVIAGHDAAWENYRQTLGDAVAMRPEGAAPTMAAEPVAPALSAPSAEKSVVEPAAAEAVPATGIEEYDARLKLLSASPEMTEGGDAGAESRLEQVTRLRDELALAIERGEVQEQTNTELNSRLGEAEALIESLQRLISLKDDKLAAMQAGFAAGQMAEEEAPAEEAPAMVAPEVMPETEMAEPEAPAADEAMDEIIIDAVDDAAGGILDSVPGGMQTVAMAAGGLVLVIIVFVFLRRRSASESADAASGISMDEAETVLSSTGVEAAEAITRGADEEATVVAGSVEPAVADDAIVVAQPPPADDDATVVAGAPEAPVEDAAPPPAAEPEIVAPPETPEVDPFADLGVYLAYERFDQAEDLVRSVLKNAPERVDYKLKLLEVFYQAGNKDAYEQYASELKEDTGGAGSDWAMVASMWEAMSPERELFAPKLAGEDDAVPEDEGVLDVTRGGTGDEAAPESLDFDLGGGDDAPAAGAEDVLDITAAAEISDLTGEDGGVDIAVPGASEPAAAAGSEDLLDVTASHEVDDTGEDLLDVTAAGQPSAVADNVLDETVNLTLDTVTAAEEAQPDISMEFDLDDMATDASTVDSDEDPGSGTMRIDTAIGDDGEVVLDIGAGGSADDATALELEIPASEDEATVLELDIGGSDDDATVLELDTSTDDDAATEVLSIDEGATAADDDFSIDFTDAADDEKQPTEALSIDGDEGGLSLEIEPDDSDEKTQIMAPGTADVLGEDLGLPTDMDEVSTKLDLAKAYIELGDADGAKAILDEVAGEGSDTQKAEAAELLAQL